MAEEHNLNIRARLDTSDIQAKLKNLNSNNPANGSTNSLSLNNVLLQLNNTLRSLQIAIRQMQASNSRQAIPQNANLRNNMPFMPAGARAPSGLIPPTRSRSQTPIAIKKLQNYEKAQADIDIKNMLETAKKSNKVWEKLKYSQSALHTIATYWDVHSPEVRDFAYEVYNIDPKTKLPRTAADANQLYKSFGLDRLKETAALTKLTERLYAAWGPWALERLNILGTSHKDFQKRMDLMFPKHEHRLSKATLAYLGSNFVAEPMAGWAELQQLRGNDTAAYYWRQGSNAGNNIMQGVGLGYMVGGPYGAAYGAMAGMIKTAVDAWIESLQESARALQEQTKLYEANVKAGSEFFRKYDLAEKNRLEDKALDAYQKNINIRSIDADLARNKNEREGIDRQIEWLRNRLTVLANPVFDDNLSDDEKTRLKEEYNDEYKVDFQFLQDLNQRRSKVLSNIERLEGFRESQDKFLENEDRAYYATLKADYPDTSITDFEKTLSYNKRFSKASDAAESAAFDAYDIASKLASARSNEYITRGIYEKRREELRDLVNSGNFNLNDYEQLKYRLNESRNEWQEAKAKSSSLENIQNANNRFEINSLQDWISEIEKAIGNLTKPDLSNVQSMASIGANMGENDINVERQMNYWAKTIELQTTMKNLLDKIEQKENSATFN